MKQSLKSGEIEYSLIRKKMKNIRIRITGASEVIVSAPQVCPEKRIKDFVAENHKMIISNLEKIDRKRMLYYPAQYKSGESFHHLGVLTELNVIESEKRSANYKGNCLILTVPYNSDQEYIKNFFKSWSRRRAKKIFSERTEKIAPSFDDRIKQEIKISVRNMLTRWGSINTKRHTISLSVHLLRCEPELIDYVITHELCHLAHSNHSKEFYRELERYYPNRKVFDKMLEMYGLVDFN